MLRPFGMHRCAIQHARLAHGKVCHIDHFLNFAVSLPTGEGAGTAAVLAVRMLVTTLAVVVLWKLRGHAWIGRLVVVLVAAFGLLVAYQAAALILP